MVPNFSLFIFIGNWRCSPFKRAKKSPLEICFGVWAKTTVFSPEAKQILMGYNISVLILKRHHHSTGEDSMISQPSTATNKTGWWWQEIKPISCCTIRHDGCHRIVAIPTRPQMCAFLACSLELFFCDWGQDRNDEMMKWWISQLLLSLIWSHYIKSKGNVSVYYVINQQSAWQVNSLP